MTKPRDYDLPPPPAEPVDWIGEVRTFAAMPPGPAREAAELRLRQLLLAEDRDDD